MQTTQNHIYKHINHTNQPQTATKGCYKYSLSGPVVVKLPIIEMLESTVASGLGSRGFKSDVPFPVLYTAISSDVAKLVFAATTHSRQHFVTGCKLIKTV